MGANFLAPKSSRHWEKQPVLRLDWLHSDSKLKVQERQSVKDQEPCFCDLSSRCKEWLGAPVETCQQYSFSARPYGDKERPQEKEPS